MKIAVTTYLCSSSYIDLNPSTCEDNNISEAKTKITNKGINSSWIGKCIKNKKDYSDKNGYTFIKKELKKMPIDRNISWYKIKYLLEIMEDSSIDWIFQTDFDSLFMRDDIKLESIIERAENFGKKAVFPNQSHGLCSASDSGKLTYTEPAFCAGHFLIKNCKWSKNLLQKMWDFPEESINHIRLLHGQHHEQCVINIFLRENKFYLRDNSLIVENRLINSFMEGSTFETKPYDADTAYSEGDFIIHFAGMNFEQRDILVDEYLHRKNNKDKSTWRDIDWSQLINGLTYEELRKKEKKNWALKTEIERQMTRGHLKERPIRSRARKKT